MDADRRATFFGLLVLALQSSLSAPADADGLPQPRLALVADHSDDPVLGIEGTCRSSEGNDLEWLSVEAVGIENIGCRAESRNDG